MPSHLKSGVAGLLLSLAVTGAASAADVTVRVEGSNAPLVRTITVSPKAGTFTKNQQGGTVSCQDEGGASALELATAGDWLANGSSPQFGLFVDAIKQEAHGNDNAYWNFNINGEAAQVGICGYAPRQGDQLLFFPQCLGPDTTGCFTGDPLFLTAAGPVKPGVPFKVTATQISDTTGVRSPAVGATITGGTAPVTAGADGTANVTVAKGGVSTLTVSKLKQVRNEIDVCASTGSDGLCGYSVPSAPGVPPVGTPAATRDTRRPVAVLRGLKDSYKKNKGPRTLRSTAVDLGSGLKDVSYSLQRRYRGTCKAFGANKSRFRKVDCGRALPFSVGTDKDVSYLLPARLKSGRYKVTLIATDNAGNRLRIVRRFKVK